MTTNTQWMNYLTAEQAFNSFSREEYITGFNEVMEAINEACLTQHQCVVNIPTVPLHGDFTIAYWITKKLSKLGYDVVMCHDSENGSSELTVKWG